MWIIVEGVVLVLLGGTLLAVAVSEDLSDRWLYPRSGFRQRPLGHGRTNVSLGYLRGSLGCTGSAILAMGVLWVLSAVADLIAR